MWQRVFSSWSLMVHDRRLLCGCWLASVGFNLGLLASGGVHSDLLLSEGVDLVVHVLVSVCPLGHTYVCGCWLASVGFDLVLLASGGVHSDFLRLGVFTQVVWNEQCYLSVLDLPRIQRVDPTLLKILSGVKEFVSALATVGAGIMGVVTWPGLFCTCFWHALFKWVLNTPTSNGCNGYVVCVGRHSIWIS